MGNINGKKCRHCSRTPWVFLGALNSIFGGKWRVTWENKGAWEEIGILAGGLGSGQRMWGTSFDLCCVPKTPAPSTRPLPPCKKGRAAGLWSLLIIAPERQHKGRKTFPLLFILSPAPGSLEVL